MKSMTTLIRGLLVLTLFFATLNTLKAQATKTAKQNGNWNAANTWESTGMPGDGDIIVIPEDYTVTVRGTDHVLNDAILIIEGDLVMESTCGICTNYGSLTFTGASSGIILESTGSVTDGTWFGGDSHFLSVQGTTVWSGDDCNFNCGLVVGNYSPSATVSFPLTISNPLPVEMLSFDASYNNEQILLEWSTASELNNSHFEIQRSTDGQNFTTIGEISGAGDSKSTLDYTFTDNNLPEHQGNYIYYRIKQVDFDGGFEYFNTYSEIPFQPLHTNQSELHIWPVPFESELNIQIYLPAKQSLQVKLYDTEGHTITSMQELGQSGVNELTLSALETIPKGIYILEIGGDNEIKREKIIKR